MLYLSKIICFRLLVIFTVRMKHYCIAKQWKQHWNTGWFKKAPYFVFHPKVAFYNFLPYFSGGVDSRSGRFFWFQYESNWTIYYAAADKNHQGILCLIGIFSGIMAKDEQCRPLCASATFPVFRHFATKCWILLLSGILFLSKSLLDWRCVRRTDFVAKYASMIFIRCCVV